MATNFYNSLDYPSFMEANKKWPKAKRKKGHVNTKIETHVATGKCFITFHKAEKMRSVIVTRQWFPSFALIVFQQTFMLSCLFLAII